MMGPRGVRRRPQRAFLPRYPRKGVLAVSDATPMSTALAPLDFKGNPVHVVMIDGAPWFEALDVCALLDIRARDAMSALDEDEKLRDSIAGGPVLDYMSESGVYSTILRSRKPEAKEFKRWVTREVLPSIRKTGAYVAPTMSALDAIQAMVDQLRVQDAAIRELADGSRDHDARLAAIEGRHDWYSALGYARLHQLPTSHVWLNRLGVTAGTIGRRHGLQTQKVQHSLFGEVNSWPEWVWTAAVEARRAAGDTMGGM